MSVWSEVCNSMPGARTWSTVYTILQNRHVPFVEDAKLEEINDAMNRKKVFRRSTGFFT